MKFLILILALALTLTSCQQKHGHIHEAKSSSDSAAKYDGMSSDSIATFPTVGYIKVHEETINFPVEKVFPLFEPQGRTLLYKNWNPTVLREGINGSLKGQVLFSKNDDLDVMLTVREYNPEKGHIQYLVVWDDFEIQRIDIYCTQAETENSTIVKWVEHNAGLYEKGIPLVKMFVEEGHLDKAVERYVKNIKKQLKNEK